MVCDNSAVILGPALHAVSGVSTHLNMVLGSALSLNYRLEYFQVGSEGREESIFGKSFRLVTSPIWFGLHLARRRPDIVHLNTSLVPNAYWRDLSYLFIARCFGRKVLTQIHGGALPCDFAKNGLTRYLLRWFLTESNVVTVLSSEELVAYKAFEHRAEVELVPNAIATDGLMVRRSERTGKHLRLVYVGRIVESKGLFDVLCGLKLLQAEGVKFDFRVAGSGPDEDEFRRLVSKYGLERLVELLGPVFGAQKAELWLESDLLLFPTYSEGLPYSILEALAAGCVPVTCSVGGIPDLMEDGVHGVFVAPRDPHALAQAVKRFAAEPALLESMAVAGRRRVSERYTVARLAGDLDGIYSRLLADEIMIR